MRGFEEVSPVSDHLTTGSDAKIFDTRQRKNVHHSRSGSPYDLSWVMCSFRVVTDVRLLEELPGARF